MLPWLCRTYSPSTAPLTFKLHQMEKKKAIRVHEKLLKLLHRKESYFVKNLRIAKRHMQKAERIRNERQTALDDMIKND